MLDRESPAIPFSTEALQASLLRLQNEWDVFQSSRGRDAARHPMKRKKNHLMQWYFCNSHLISDTN
jgi:hypothetical protein